MKKARIRLWSILIIIGSCPFCLTLFTSSSFNRTIIKTLRQGIIQKQRFIQVLFPPFDEVETLLGELIDEETEKIDLEMFQFTNKFIADKLIAAHQRGVNIRIIADIGSLGRFGKILYLFNAGIPVYIYPQQDSSSDYTLMHNKIMLLYSLQCILTGSMNFTQAGVRNNWENFLVVQDEDVFIEYERQFKMLLKETTPLSNSSKNLPIYLHKNLKRLQNNLCKCSCVGMRYTDKHLKLFSAADLLPINT